MNAEPRMVTVTVIETRLADITEPDWCVDPHTGAHHFTDLTHNGTETAARIHTANGQVTFLRAWISHAPYLESGAEPYPVVTIELDGDSCDFHPAEVVAVSMALRDRADELDELAAQATRIRRGQA